VIARVSLALVAVVVIAWLAVMERNTRLQTRAVAESGRPPISNAYRDFRRARFLNPDTAPDVLIALIDSVHGKSARGIATLQGVVRREPENLFAWGQLFKIAQGHDQAVADHAYAELARLDPLDYGRGARRGG
jgi:hypothetical protein